jgi:hypothetical protein
MLSLFFSFPFGWFSIVNNYFQRFSFLFDYAFKEEEDKTPRI